MRHPALIEVSLVIFLRAVECWRRLNLGNDWPPEATALFQVGQGRFGLGLLLRRMVENGGAILASKIRPLPVWCGRVVVQPEDIEEFAIGNFRRVEFDLYHLRMAGFVGTDVF